MLTAFRLTLAASLLALLLAPSRLAAEAITSVEQARQLSTEAALAGQPVEITGVVTYLRFTEVDFNFSLHDATGGVMVYPRERVAIKPGQRVTVKGFTAIAGHGLRIAEATVQPHEMSSPPAPLPVSPAALREGSNDGDFIEMEGILRQSRLESPLVLPRRLALDFGPQRQRLTAWITGFDPERDLLPAGSLVRVRGVVVHWTNPLGQPQSTSIMANAMSDVRLLKPPPAPARLMLPQVQTETVGPKARQVTVQGQLTWLSASLVVIQQGDSAVRVRGDFQALEGLKLGLSVEATGFPSLGDYSVELEDATLVPLPEAPSNPLPPQPMASIAEVLRSQNLLDRDALLIALEARLLALREDGEQLQLELQAGNKSFTANLPANSAELPTTVRPGSELRLTGLCTLHLTDERRRLGRAPDAFSLLLRDATDIVVLKPGPWWTAGRLQLALSLAGVGLALLSLWAWQLRHKNRRLREEIAARLRAESDLANERRRVSNQLHDTLQQTITAASLQLHAASHLVKLEPGEAAAAVTLAQQLLHRGRDEVRDAVWDLRVDDRARVDLGDLLERLCQESNRQPPAKPQLHFAADSPALLPAHQATQIVRIAREAITNALKHAQAETLSIHLETEAAGLMLTIADDGQGFDPAATPGPETGHFGLGSMRERAERLGAELRLTSAPGQGTTLTLHLPLP